MPSASAPPTEEPPPQTEVLPEEQPPAPPEEQESAHSRAQDALIRLGKITDCNVWIASNDRNRVYEGRRLGEDCLTELPNLGLPEEAAKTIALIDVIWIQQQAPIAAIEVERTTSISSGLLRMCDLLSLVPALNVKLYVVAPRAREKKVLAQLARPTFRKIGLSKRCRYIPTEHLYSLLDKLGGFEHGIDPSILDEIAISLETHAESS